MWGPYGECVDPDVCQDTARRDTFCGLNRRGVSTSTCVAGRWSDFGPCLDADVCVDGGQELEACGLNLRGTAVRTCVQGQWGALSVCTDPDVCRFDDTREIANSCGLNGRGTTRESCPGGRWVVDACVDPDVCQDGTSMMVDCGGVVSTASCVNGMVVLPPGC